MIKLFKILVLIIAGIMLMQACCSYERCCNKYFKNRPDTLYVPFAVEIPYQHITPEKSVTYSINLDSLCLERNKPRNITLPAVYTKRDSTKSLQLQHWLDYSTGLLNLKAINGPDTIRDTIREMYEVPCPPCPPEKKPTRIEAILNAYKNAAAVALPIIILLLVLFTIIKLKK